MTLAYLFWMSTRSSFPLNALVHRCNSDILYRKSLDWKDNKYQSHMHKYQWTISFVQSLKYIKLKQLYILFSLSVNELINLWFRLEKKVKMISYMTKKQQILTYEKLQTAKKNGIIA